MRHMLLLLTGIVFFFLSIWSPAGTAIASEPNLVAHWMLDESSGLVAHNSAGSYDGNLINGPVWTTGKVDGGLSFDGTNDYIYAPERITFTQYDSFSICYWAKPVTDGYILCKKNQYGTFYYGSYWEQQWNRFVFFVVLPTWPSNIVGTPTNSTPPGNWYHITCVFQNRNMKIYLNGQLSGSGTCNSETRVNSPLNYITIGSKAGGSNFFGGTVDDMRIYNKALSDTEIQQLYMLSFERANHPNPVYGSQNAELNSTLSWTPGIYASLHDIYFGTDFNDIDNATKTIPPGVYKGTINVNHYTCDGLLSNTTYYWRIDEVNDANIWKGRVWNFTTSAFFKNQISFPDEPFKSNVISENDPGWVKFTIKLNDPYLVYFQDSSVYPFHYEFAAEWLEPFIGMSAEEYYNVTLHDANQQAVLGAVIMPADTSIKEYGIQLIRYDAYTKEETAELFNTVKASIIAQPDVNAFYFPSYEQLAAAEANSAWLEAQGIPISSTARWATGNACYSPGWALGMLKYYPGTQINQAYADGNLLPEDILLTDGVPAEVPFLAGILTLTPSTPSSHVAILAQTFGIPFGHLALTADANKAQQLIGRLVAVTVSENGNAGNIKITDMNGLLNGDEIDQILAVKTPKPLNIAAMEPYGAYSANTNGLGPNDIRYFGGKAANFGMLRRVIPDNCPNAVALSFQLWNEFLGQILTNGKTLREEINSRLSVYTYPPADLPALYAELYYIRENLFKDTVATSFTQQQMDAIISILQDPAYGFDADRNIRFRSSTNVEDSNQFSGAGLYDSFSGCLADDLDSDTQGPCICDPVEAKERGVFRAIRKVFASFYNDNAFMERLRHGVDENDVGMGILIHHSSPDQFELANGVASLEKRQGDPNRYIKLVTQKGAVSVANPDDGSIPEEVTAVYKSETDIVLTLERSSNLVILGETVLDWPEDYNSFACLVAAASEEFEAETGKTDYLLDLEYKKLLPGGSLPDGGLAIKQIREIPKSDQQISATTPFLVNEPVTYVTMQGEIWSGTSLLYSCHRLKSRWTLNTKSMWLTAENLAQSIYSDVNIEYAAEGQIRTIKGKFPLLPNASHSFAGTVASDSFIKHHLSNPRTYTLTTNNIITQVGPADSPIVKLSDFVDPFWAEMDRELDVNAVYSRPPWPGEPTQDNIQIMPEPSDDSFRSRWIYSYEIPEMPVSISTTFYLAPYDGFHGTISLSRFVETTITGFTTEPIVLHGYYSQTYGPGRHNFTEQFLFEPRLEPGISQTILDELEAQNIRLIYAKYPDNIISTLSYDELPFIVSDSDGDGNVDFEDFSMLASEWLNKPCSQCDGSDLNDDGRVDIDDLYEFGQEWLSEL